MPKVVTVLDPEDHGRRMSLDEFEHAEGRSGFTYELSKGVVTVVRVPSRRHLAQVLELQQQLFTFRGTHRHQLHTIAGGSDNKILLTDLESERHPDLALYKSADDPDGDWASWIPTIVIEVVSPSSEQRDYEEKPPEYLAFGVAEYWIVDAAKEEVLVHRRSDGQWQWAKTVHKPDATYTTRLLPGFELDIAAVFAAARAA